MNDLPETDPNAAGPDDAADATPDVATDPGRRAAFRKIAVYGAFTAPLLLGVLKSEKAVAFTF